MAANAPTTQFRDIPTSTTDASLNTKSKRASAVGGESTVATGAGNEWDFGTVDISGGQANSSVKMLFWNVVDANGNTNADNFRFWLSNNGFQVAASVMRHNDGGTNAGGISFSDTGTNNNTEEYVQNAITSSYTFEDAQESEPGTQNFNAADDTTSVDITGITPSTEASEVVAIPAYFVIADEEFTGTYKGTDTGKELQCSFKFDFN